MKTFLNIMHESGALYVLIVTAFVVTSLVYCEYQMTKRALTEVTGKAPSFSLVWYAIAHNIDISNRRRVTR